MKNMLVKLIALIIFVTYSLQEVRAYDFEVDGIYYNINAAEKTATVTYGDKKYSGNVIIQPLVKYGIYELPVVSIESAFLNCINLTSVEIPNSVKSIDSSAFRGCSSLESIELPNSVKYIGPFAFENCIGIKTITIPNSVVSLREYAFNGCSGLESIELPNSLESISLCTFSGCSSLKSIKIPNSVVSIGNYAFSGCTSLTSIEISGSVTSIGYEAFSGCTGLTDLFFEDGVKPLTLTTVKAGDTYLYVSFQDCPITNLYLGRNLDYPFGSNYGYTPTPFSKNTDFKILSLGKYVHNAYPIYPEKCNGLEEINCYNTYPPSIYKFSTMQYVNIIVNVPKGSLEKYQTYSIWENFWNLNDILPNENIPSDGEEDDVPSIQLDSNERYYVYSIEGALIKRGCSKEELSQLPKGIYIIVSDNQRFKISL